MKDILHCDINNFFASCEMLTNPQLKDVPLVVGGNEDDRHGVVLAKNYIAKDYGIQTGMTLYQARKLCPKLVSVDTHFDVYEKYSKQVRDILLKYTDRVEPFSIDESWLDVTHSKIFGTPEEIADKIREEIKRETGLTVSIGVSFNKVFAKLGSDMKKPDAITIINLENFKSLVWSLSVDNLLGVGKATQEKLKKYGITTIGALARSDEKFLIQLFGKIGKELHDYANGNSSDEVPIYDEQSIQPKSVGNTTTFYKNLTDMNEIELGFTVLAESVVTRMIKQSIDKAKTLLITVKDSQMNIYTRQTKLKIPCRDSVIYTKVAIDLFNKSFQRIPPIRLLGISVSNFVKDDLTVQITMFNEKPKENKLDEVMLKIREKYGHNAIIKGNGLYNKRIANTFNESTREENKNKK